MPSQFWALSVMVTNYKLGTDTLKWSLRLCKRFLNRERKFRHVCPAFLVYLFFCSFSAFHVSIYFCFKKVVLVFTSVVFCYVVPFHFGPLFILFYFPTIDGSTPC